LIEAKLTGVPDKGQPANVRLVIATAAILLPPRLGKHANPLVISNGFDIDAGDLGKSANRHHAKLLAPVATTGFRIADWIRLGMGIDDGQQRL
jgi:hypothetical protein